MKRQLLLALAIAIAILLLGVLLINLKPSDKATVRFVAGVEPQEIRGAVKIQDKYIIIKPDGASSEQTFTWDKVKDITGEPTFFAKRFGDVYDVAEFLTKLAAFAAAGVFLVGLYQYEQGQAWKRAEFMAGVVKDISANARSENAKLMLDCIKLYHEGRKIKLFPDEATPSAQYRTVKPIKILRSLQTTMPIPSDEESVAIRDCFDSFFTQLERLDQYIISHLVTKEAVYTYMNYWIDLLSGHDSDFREHDRWYLLNYADVYKFPGVELLLGRCQEFIEAPVPPSGHLS
jgi:hypothetical protein